ncbi:GNAT family N-acetyltransferase [Aeromonas hydrophila]|uniref:GNAT family N-acetyltransferase n=1 Tax=Aeromonas hydrophila TaxID=644 RepID=UPI003EC8507B
MRPTWCAIAAMRRSPATPSTSPIPTRRSARDWLAGCWRKVALGLGWSWALTLPAGEGQAPLVGVISLHWNGELAWWVGVPWQNRGLATRAARLVKAFAFERLQLPVLTARHMPGNLASGRVMAKLGMRYCGRRELSGQPPCEVSYWQLERSQTLAAPLTRQLTPLLADERVVAAILQAGAEEDEPRRLALFLVQPEPEPESGLAVDSLPEQEGNGPLAVEYHDQAVLAQAEPDQLYLYRGLLLKDHEEQGLDYLQQLASLQRQGPAPLTLAERRQRLGWLGTLARRASGENTQGEGVSRRYHQLWLLVELPALIDELAGRWHRGPDQTLSWLEQGDAELFAAYRVAIITLQPSDLQALLRLLAVRFPESTLPFLDKGAQGGGQFVE